MLEVSVHSILHDSSIWFKGDIINIAEYITSNLFSKTLEDSIDNL